jgi:ubiquinone/menaquinone biosynthesis C-methylase UbiE
MDARLQRRIQRYGWDAASKSYEHSWRENLAPAHRIMFEMAALSEGEQVLDTACGSGLVTIPAAMRVGAPGHVMATDISDEMVALVLRAAAEAGCSNVTASRMDAETLDVEDCRFDAALCGLGLMYVPEPLNALREMHRTLRPQGRAVAAVWGERRNCGWAEIFPIVDGVVQSEVCPLFFRTGTGHVLAEEFAAAGFSGIEERRIAVPSAFASQGELLTALLDGGPVALAARRFTAGIRSQVERELLASVAPHRLDDGSYDVPGEFVIVKGVKA